MLSNSAVVISATPQQEGIWFHSVVHGTPYWNFTYVKAYKGTLHVQAFREALQRVLGSHSALRTNFRIHANQLCQVINPEVPVDDVLDCEKLEAQEEAEIVRRVNSEARRLESYAFDLERDPLLRCKVLESKDAVFFIVVVNHIVTDSVSMQIFWNELKTYYNASVAGLATSARPPGRQYADFSRELQALRETDAYQRQKQSRLDKLSGDLPVLELPCCRDRSKATVCIREIALPPQLVRDVKSLALKKRVLYSSVFQLAYFILLHKYSGQREILVGNVVNGRGAGTQNNNRVMGLFANRLVNMQALRDDDVLADLLQRVHDDLDRSVRENIPYEELMREVNAKSRKGLSLFRAAFNVVKRAGADSGFTGLTERTDFNGGRALHDDQQYDSYLYVVDYVKSVRVRLELRCDDALQPVVEFMLDAYVRILGSCVQDLGQKLIVVGGPAGREKELLDAFNRTSEGPPAAGTVIHALFRDQVKQDPGRVALVFGEEALTYRELDQRSDAIAAQLRQWGIGRETLVGLLLNRSPAMVSCMLGVLKAGAAYLPLDPGFPPMRMGFMLEDSGVRYVITQRELGPKLPAGATALFADDFAPAADGPGPTNINQPQDLIYVIYTSGSTGQPKGVMIEHQSVANFITGITDQVAFRGKRIYALTTISFDIFVLESLLALCAGATIVLAGESAQRDPSEAAAAIVKNRVQMLQATPSRMKMLLEAETSFLAGLSDILIGGEAFPAELLATLRKEAKGRIFNVYGPTETTVWSAMKELTLQPAITIGKPIRNTQIHIINGQGQGQPIGTYGEICIAGAGLARGYLGQPGLTKAKFAENPFAPGTSMYKTGDIGRWLPNGELEIKGRCDDQVKIRGYRVELGEVEFCLKSHPRVKDAVVIHKQNEQYEHLYAFYVSREIIKTQEIRNYLRERLPEYMIPTYFVHLDAIPTTPNNKIDRNALRSNQVVNLDLNAYSGRMNGRLVALWGKVLQIDSETIFNNPFSDFFGLGGHSLDALYLLSDIEREFNQTILLKEFFKSPTLYYLNDRITPVPENQPLSAGA